MTGEPGGRHRFAGVEDGEFDGAVHGDGDGHRVLDARAGAYRGVDLGQFGPDAVHLDLGVQAAQVEQAVVVGAADPVAGAVVAQAVPFQEASGVVGRVEVARGQLGSGDTQFALTGGARRAFGVQQQHRVPGVHVADRHHRVQVP